MQIGFRTVLAASLAMAGGFCRCRVNRKRPCVHAAPQGNLSGAECARVDPAQIYPVSDLRLRRDAVSLTFSDGTIGFLEAYDGRVTGAVFSGRGHVSANLRDPAERQSLAHFLGVPLLDQNFSGAYLRFDDASADEILDQLRHAGAAPKNDADFVATWNRALPNLNPGQSTRLLLDWTAETPAPYFYAELLDERLGAYEVIVDRRRTDSVMIGQERWASGNQYYDVWASFPGTDTPRRAPGIRPGFVRDRHNDQSRPHTRWLGNHRTARRPWRRTRDYAGTLALPLGAIRAGRRWPRARFFPERRDGRSQLAEQGDDLVFVFLPENARAGQTYRIRMTYRGSVISDAGNGVYFVGDRGIWYPHIGGMGQFATFDTTFRWPRKLQLVATGEKVDEREEGERRVGHWRSEGQTALAGFNLGDYKVENMETVDGVKIQVAANSELETAIVRTAAFAIHRCRTATRRVWGGRTGVCAPPVDFSIDDANLPVAGALKDVGIEISSAIRFEQQWMGPFPLHRLVVSQVPGELGQGFPGLLYLPSLSFLPITQQRAGISSNTQETLNALSFPYHEVAHQWWGNVVGWDNYRDQWLDEGLANYVALVGADSEKPGTHLLTHWLDQYRKALTTPVSGQQEYAGRCGATGARISPEFLARSGRLSEDRLWQGHMGVSHAAHDDAGPRVEKSG